MFRWDSLEQPPFVRNHRSDDDCNDDVDGDDSVDGMVIFVVLVMIHSEWDNDRGMNTRKEHGSVVNVPLRWIPSLTWIDRNNAGMVVAGDRCSCEPDSHCYRHLWMM